MDRDVVLFSLGNIKCFAQPDAAEVYFETLTPQDKSKFENIIKKSAKDETDSHEFYGIFSNRQITVDFLRKVHSIEGIPGKSLQFRITEIKIFRQDTKVETF